MGLIAGQITLFKSLFGRYRRRQTSVTVTTLNVKNPHVVKRYEGFFLEIVPLIITVYNFDEEFNENWSVMARSASILMSSHDWPTTKGR